MEHIFTGARRPWRLVILALLGLVITGLAATNASPVAAAQEADWKILGFDPGKAVIGGGQQSYALHNVTRGRNVRYGERDYGINLVWADAGDNRHLISFDRQAGFGPVSYDEPVAIEVNGHGYLRYAEREYGINLVWSATPVYEWRIRGGQGTVKEGETVALYNTVRGSTVVYAERPYGINLRWFADTLPAGMPTSATVDLGFQFGGQTFPISCSGRIIWRLTPVSLTGTDGVATAVTIDHEHQNDFGAATQIEPGRWVCRFTARVPDSLRTGTWRVTVVNDVTCEVLLHAGLNSVKFTKFVGCSTGVDYPRADPVARVDPGSLPDILLDPAPIAVADPTVPTLVATEPPAATPILSPSWPVLQPGAEGEAVTSLQYLLRHDGHDVAVDGTFSPPTAAAVAAFQQGLGLRGDGSVGAETWTALIVPVRRGSQGDAVRAVQRQLAARGVAISEDGEFGPQTEQAVQAYQQAQGLTADGIVAPPTWQALVAGR